MIGIISDTLLAAHENSGRAGVQIGELWDE